MPTPTRSKREYNDEEVAELLRTVRVARVTPRGPALARVLFVLTVLGPVVVFGAIVAMMFQSPTAVTGLWPVIMIAVLMFVAAYFACVVTRRRFKNRVLAKDGKVCPNCHYDLARVEDVGDVQFCPECREPFRMADLRRVWSGWSAGMVWWD